MLTDAGPLVALLDRTDPAHTACADVLRGLQTRMVTTWPAFTEAMYLVRARHRRAGWRAQELLWRIVIRGELELAPLDEPALRRARDLMKKYRDLPMDLADATLVAVAEARGMSRVFTLDSDFRVYRIGGRRPLEVVP